MDAAVRQTHMQRVLVLRLTRLLVLIAVTVLLLTAGARAGDEPSCTCAKRRACWHYLNSPSDPPDDPCSCEKCETRERHSGGTPIKGWSPACWSSSRLDCFLKRHAASWRLACSACQENVKCCPLPGVATCPNCGEAGHADPFTKDPLRNEARRAIAEQMEVERRYFKKKAPVIVYSRRFYVVTDVKRMRIRNESGGQRWATGHEWAHLMVQRAEIAFDEFSEAFGGGVRLLRPMGIFMPRSMQTARPLQAAYFRAERNHMIYSSYASRSESSISDGFCLNGFCVPIERMKGNASASKNNGGEDYAMHFAMRHMIGHILITCWLRNQGDNRTMPRWAFVGAGQWLGKRIEKLSDNVYHCSGEDQKLSGSGKDWWGALRKRAALGKFTPIGELIDKTSLGHLDYEDRRQSWGYFHLGMEEWRGGFVKLIAALRREKDQRESFREHLGVTPEQFHARFVERLLEKRDRLGPPDGGKAEPEADAATAHLNPTLDADALASQIRTLGTPETDEHARELLDVIGTSSSDLVRETAAERLRGARSEVVHRAIMTAGLTHASRITRSHAARLCGELGLKAARVPLRALHDDAFWLARAESFIASGRILDFDAQARIRTATTDAAAKVRIGAMDALTYFGERVNPQSIPPVCTNLDHRAWQVRLAAAQTLEEVGDDQAIEPLIARLEKESGRVRTAIVDALEEISGEHFGAAPAAWKGWWEREGESIRERGFTTGVKETDPERPSRYGGEVPEYYGIDVFSQRVAFVIDTSKSTDRIFRPNPSTKSRLLGDYDGEPVTVNDICRSEIGHSIQQLDPRARFNVLSFGSRVQTWKRNLVPASGSNKAGGASFVRSQAPAGETNFYGALAAALDLEAHPLTSAKLGDSPDTIFFLTDGTPTVGDITDPDLLAHWYTTLNRYTRVRTHTIAFGTLGVDEPLLRELSRDNWGTFTQLFESD